MKYIILVVEGMYVMSAICSFSSSFLNSHGLLENRPKIYNPEASETLFKPELPL